MTETKDKAELLIIANLAEQAERYDGEYRLRFVIPRYFSTFSQGTRTKFSREGGGGTSYNGLYLEAPPERGTIFILQVYKRVGILQVEVYKRVGKFRYLKGPLIILFRIDAPYGCISLFIKHYMNMKTRPLEVGM